MQCSQSSPPYWELPLCDDPRPNSPPERPGHRSPAYSLNPGSLNPPKLPEKCFKQIATLQPPHFQPPVAAIQGAWAPPPCHSAPPMYPIWSTSSPSRNAACMKSAHREPSPFIPPQPAADPLTAFDQELQGPGDTEFAAENPGSPDPPASLIGLGSPEPQGNSVVASPRLAEIGRAHV